MRNLFHPITTRLVTLALLLHSSTVSAEIFKCKNAQGQLTFSDRPCSAAQLNHQIEHAAKPSPSTVLDTDKSQSAAEIPAAVDTPPPVLSSVKIRARTLLEDERFSELNELLHDYFSQALENPASEATLFSAYNSFDYRSAEYRLPIDRWIAATPFNYQPYLARAFHSYGLGWKARGTKFSSETSEAKRLTMRSHFEDAQQDLAKASSLQAPTLISTYLELGIWKTLRRPKLSGDVEQDQAVKTDYFATLQTAESTLAAYPWSYQIRAQLMYALFPRWGGTHEAMRIVAKEAQPLIHLNPKFAWLQGFIALDRSTSASASGSYIQVATMLEEALGYGENPAVLHALGRNSYRRELFAESISYLSRALKSDSENAEIYRWRSKANRRLGHLDTALADYESAYALDPAMEVSAYERDKMVYAFEVKAQEQLQNSDNAGAVTTLEKALRVDPQSQSSHYRLGWALYKLGNYRQALASAKQARRIDPNHYNSYHLIDLILVQYRDWDQIIAYWEKYMEINPNNANAYFERFGTYWNKGDREAAIRDLKRAAELGHVKAKSTYQEILERGY